MKSYDLVVLGGGPGGYVAAIKAAQNNLKVALIEKDVIGGICLNHGCIPTKAILKSTKTYDLFKNAKSYGINVEKDAFSFDLTSIIRRKDGIVRRLTTGVKMLLKKNGVDVYNGYGEVLNKNEVSVNDETIRGDNLIIATGGTAIIPPIPGAKEAYKSGFAVTSMELLNVTDLPKKLTIIGGGVIGVEFATIFNSLGSEVTIIEMQETIVSAMDEEIIDEYSKILKKSGVKVITGCEVKKVSSNSIVYSYKNEEKELPADLVLLAVGIRPNIDSFKKINLKMAGSGVEVNERLQTSLENVYAIGDVTGKHMLAHVASAEGIVAVENILGTKTKINYNQIPAAIYGSPEIATIGMTEKEAQNQNLKYTVSKFPLLANGKALADGDSTGFIKIIKGLELDEILGAHILAYNAVDLISEIAVAMRLESTNKEVASTIHPHPSLSEIIMEAAMDKPINF